MRRVNLLEPNCGTWMELGGLSGAPPGPQPSPRALIPLIPCCGATRHFEQGWGFAFPAPAPPHAAVAARHRPTLADGWSRGQSTANAQAAAPQRTASHTRDSQKSTSYRLTQAPARRCISQTNVCRSCYRTPRNCDFTPRSGAKSKLKTNQTNFPAKAPAGPKTSPI